MPLSPYVEEPLNSKVIKSFVPEQKSRYVFFEFRDFYVLSLWTFDVRFTHSHIMAMVHIKKRTCGITLYLKCKSKRRVHFIKMGNFFKFFNMKKFSLFVSLGM